MRRRGQRGPLLLAMLIGLTGGLFASMPLAKWLSSNPLPSNPRITNPFAAWNGIGDQNILLLGTDVGGGNTDVIATLRIDGGVTRITQVPRDTYIEAEGYGPQKINALYAIGGTELLERELSRKMGRPITHHVVVNLSAIRRMADALGGIEVDVPKRMYYTDNSQGLYIDLQPGPQNLKGRDLEGFLRFRHDEWGDIGRIERQQLALKALFRKLTRPEHLVRLPILLGAGGKDLKTDLGPMELGGLITAMGSTQLETERLGGRPFMLDGISYWETDWPGPNEADRDDFDNRYVY
ncbi:LCP family protein [Aphanothece microscopica]|uniref:LCP family protein n=1 Tax=Aphanothece microscopica TaxID=1049561 RepID=UPI003CE562CC